MASDVGMRLPARRVCALCGDIRTADLIELDLLGWTWWTGFLPVTEYACPTCRKFRPDAVASRLAASRVPPSTADSEPAR